MRPIRIAGADERPLGAPADWSEETHGHCQALFIRREKVEGVAFMRSAHEVDAHEAALLYAGASLTLGIQGVTHPVIQLGIGEVPEFEPIMHARRFYHADGRPMVRVEMLFCHPGGLGRAFAEEHVDGTLADAVSTGIIKIERIARKRNWIE